LKKIALLLVMLTVFPLIGFAQQGYLEVTAPGNRQLNLAVANPVPLSGGENTTVSRDIVDVFRFDMTLAGPFTVMGNTPTDAKSGIRPGEFNFAPWKGAGADIIIKTGYVVSGTTLTLECRLFDVNREREVLAKRYTGSITDLRRISHTFSDEIMQALTGERGPFTGKIAFVSAQTGNKELYLMDYDGHNVQRLTRNGSINLNPDFSPSGKEVIYTSYKKGNPDLYRRELFSGSEARIASNRGINVTAAYSPDGSRIALAMSKDGNSEIYVIGKDGKQQNRLTKNNAIEVSPAWSPDGRQVAFVSDRLGKPQVFIMNADGSGVRRLTTNGSYNVSPRWSPKGDRIVYCRQQGGGFQVYAINPDGSRDVPLTSEGSNEHPRWSPDGRYITFSS